MGIFDNYQNINPNYIPNNINPPPNPCKPKLEPCRPIKPYEEYNAEGKLVGYYWYYGDTINLEFNVDGEVTIIDGEEAISALDFLIGKYVIIDIYNFRGEIVATQKLYTTTILKRGSEIKTGSVINGIVYNDDAILSEDETIIQQSTLKFGSKLANETIINNEKIDKEKVINSDIILYPGTKILFEIDKELSNKLVKGVYTCTLTLYNADDSFVDTLFSQTDGNLIVK